MRHALLLCGALRLAGTVGPIVRDMRLQLVGVLGYAGVLPVVAILLVRSFAGERVANDRPVAWLRSAPAEAGRPW